MERGQVRFGGFEWVGQEGRAEERDGTGDYRQEKTCSGGFVMQ